MNAYLSLAKNPIGSISYLVLILSMASVWINRQIWIWGGLFVISFVLAYYSGIVEIQVLVPIVILFLCHASLTQEVTMFWRLFSVMIASVISIGMLTHFVNGFHNIKLLENWQISKDGVPINLYLNYDKPIVALFIIGLYLPLIQTARDLKKMLAKTIPWIVLTLAVVLGIAYYLHMVKVDLKLPSITLLWLLIQIFFVIIPEEVFFRGFIQREIRKNLNNSAAGVLAVLVASLLFTLLHIFFIPDMSYLIAVFLTSLLYGAIYEMTGAIESSILTHLTVNTVHLFFFTYPMLNG